MGNLSKIPAKDLEAKIEEREKKIPRIINHIRTLHPTHSFWSDNYFGTSLYEDTEDGRKIKNYHGFNVLTGHLAGSRERTRLEYGRKVVLDIVYPIGYVDSMKEVNIISYKEGKWEEAFDKILEMGWPKSLDLYLDPINKARERKKEAEHKKRIREAKRAQIEERARSLGM